MIYPATQSLLTYIPTDNLRQHDGARHLPLVISATTSVNLACLLKKIVGLGSIGAVLSYDAFPVVRLDASAS